jgi:hypothetical protein
MVAAGWPDFPRDDGSSNADRDFRKFDAIRESRIGAAKRKRRRASKKEVVKAIIRWYPPM